MEKKTIEISNQKKQLFNFVAILTIFLFIIGSLSGCINQQTSTIKVSGANALQPMMEVWAKEYTKLHPNINIIVSGGGAGKGMTDALAGIVDIGMVSREVKPDEITQGAFWVSVAIDAVVATMNSNNPLKEEILKKGVTKEQLRDIFTNKYEDRTIKTWGKLVGNDSLSTERIWVYTRQDACGAAEMWAKYLGKYLQDNLSASADTAVTEDPNLRAILIGDIRGIGYNNINTVYDPQTKEPYDGIIPIPIDLNGNGAIDPDENFYTNISQITTAIKNHVYPWPPARHLYLVTKNNFTGITKEFVNWILMDGQQYVPTSGYIALPQETLQQQLIILQKGVRT